MPLRVLLEFLGKATRNQARRGGNRVWKQMWSVPQHRVRFGAQTALQCHGVISTNHIGIWPPWVGTEGQSHIPPESPVICAHFRKSPTHHRGIWPPWVGTKGRGHIPPESPVICAHFRAHTSPWDMASVAWDNACWRCHDLSVLKGSAEAPTFGKRVP